MTTVNETEPATRSVSLKEQLNAAKSNSKNFLAFIKNSFAILAGSVIVIFILAIFLIIPISMIVVGAIFVDSCPIQPLLPIFLLVGGCFLTMRLFASLLENLANYKRARNGVETQWKFSPFFFVIHLFLITWLFLGAYWTYSIGGRVTLLYHYETARTYCNINLYLFSYVVVTTSLILLIFSICCVSLGGYIVYVY